MLLMPSARILEQCVLSICLLQMRVLSLHHAVALQKLYGPQILRAIFSRDLSRGARLTVISLHDHALYTANLLNDPLHVQGYLFKRPRGDLDSQSDVDNRVTRRSWNDLVVHPCII